MAGATIQPFNALDPEVYEALKASIKRFGVVVPIVVDGKGRVLDGHHREAIARELGIPCPQIKRTVRNDDDATALAFSLNTDRRHLSLDERREIVADLRAKGYSLRAIAGVTKTSLGTAHNDVKASGVQVEHVRGGDGKEYDAERNTQPADEDDEPKPTEEPPPGVDPETGEVQDPGGGAGNDAATATDDPPPPAPPVDPTLGYRARASTERSKTRSGLLALDPSRVVETSDDPKAWQQFSRDVRAWLDSLDADLAGPRLKAVK